MYYRRSHNEKDRAESDFALSFYFSVPHMVAEIIVPFALSIDRWHFVCLC